MIRGNLRHQTQLLEWDVHQVLPIRGVVLGKEKAKGGQRRGHGSWLRLYAIRFQKNSYLITGGAIKLTRTMQEREHTLAELQKLELVRNFLISEGAFDLDGFYDLTNR